MRPARWRSTRTSRRRPGRSRENAAYEIGRILNERGQSAAAVAAWRRYRSDYPNGILRVEADVSIIETLAKRRRHRRRADGGDRLPAPAPGQRAARRDRARRGRSVPRARRLPARGRRVSGRAVGVARARRRRGRRPSTAPPAWSAIGEGNGVDALRSYLRSYPGRALQAAGDRAGRAGDVEDVEPLARPTACAVSPRSASLALSVAACRQTIVLDQHVDGGGGGGADSGPAFCPGTADGFHARITRGDRRARSLGGNGQPLRGHHACSRRRAMRSTCTPRATRRS